MIYIILSDTMKLRHVYVDYFEGLHKVLETN